VGGWGGGGGVKVVCKPKALHAQQTQLICACCCVCPLCTAVATPGRILPQKPQLWSAAVWQQQQQRAQQQQGRVCRCIGQSRGWPVTAAAAAATGSAAAGTRLQMHWSKQGAASDSSSSSSSGGGGGSSRTGRSSSRDASCDLFSSGATPCSERAYYKWPVLRDLGCVQCVHVQWRSFC
jgi:hypothetical protein